MRVLETEDRISHSTRDDLLSIRSNSVDYTSRDLHLKEEVSTRVVYLEGRREEVRVVHLPSRSNPENTTLVF